MSKCGVGVGIVGETQSVDESPQLQLIISISSDYKPSSDNTGIYFVQCGIHVHGTSIWMCTPGASRLGRRDSHLYRDL